MGIAILSKDMITLTNATTYNNLPSLGLTVDDAWKYILQLDETHYFRGPLADTNEKFDFGENVVWKFKMEIDGKIAYIKLKDEEGGRGCVCLSFHEDHQDWAY